MKDEEEVMFEKDYNSSLEAKQNFEVHPEQKYSNEKLETIVESPNNERNAKKHQENTLSDKKISSQETVNSEVGPKTKKIVIRKSIMREMDKKLSTITSPQNKLKVKLQTSDIGVSEIDKTSGNNISKIKTQIMKINDDKTEVAFFINICRRIN